MKTQTISFASLGGALLLIGASAVPASAIQCRGSMAYNSAAGGYIPHSICEDRLIAKVSGFPYAGKRGVKQNPNTKKEACLFAGSDPRISHLCAGLRPEDQGGRRP